MAISDINNGEQGSSVRTKLNTVILWVNKLINNNIKGDLDLDQVDNTSDEDKPISNTQAVVNNQKIDKPDGSVLTNGSTINIDFDGKFNGTKTLLTNTSAITFTIQSGSVPSTAGSVMTIWVTLDTGDPTIAITLDQTNYTSVVKDAVVSNVIDITGVTGSVFELSAAWDGSILSWISTQIK